MNNADALIRERLFALADLPYKNFNCRLLPTVDPDTVIGVRTPALRKLARELAGTPVATEFLSHLPHRYFEENNLHGFLIEPVRDYDSALTLVQEFLPHIDNWATCDLLVPQVFEKHRPELYENIKDWVASEHLYTVRFGVGMLLRFYLDEAFRPEHPALVADIRAEEYYVSMMVAWYFATALAKQPEAALPYLRERRLDPLTHRRTIQKAIESYRINADTKEYLRTLRDRPRVRKEKANAP